MHQDITRKRNETPIRTNSEQVLVLQENDAVVYNMIHGVLGEDGQLQQYLAHYGIPFTGSPEASSNICMDKLSTADFIGVRH